MNVEASRRALADACIEKDAVDAVYVKYPTSAFESMYGQKVAEALGLQPRVGGVWDAGGAANAGMVAMAAQAIEAGQREVALVTFADNARTGTAQAYQRGWGDDAVYGWFGTPTGYAMIAQRHVGEYGTTSEQLGAIAVAARKHGAASRVPWIMGDGLRDGSRQGGGRLSYRAYSSRPTTQPGAIWARRPRS